MNPKVSIVIPVYNGANYMREAIDSALTQTYDNCEVIVINDGSTDGGKTDNIAKSYGDKIRYFVKENGGVATAVNMGIEKMTGEYFAWLSHDDLFYPEKIEKQIEAIKQSNIKDAIVHCNFDFLNMETGKKTEVNWLSQYTKDQLEKSNFAPVFLCIHGSTVLMHKSHFERVGLYDTSLLATQDSEFLFRVMRNQKSIFVPESLMIGRIHREQGQQTMSCHVPEYNQMFVDFCETLTDDEKKMMCGSVCNFYYRLYLLLKYSEPANSILNYLIEKIENTKLDVSEESEFQNTWKSKLKAQGVSQVYIFGAGQFGKEALTMLSMYNIEVEGFIDNNPEKQGNKIEGIDCLSLFDIKDKEKVLIIVAMMNMDEVISQLQDYEIKNVIKYGDLKKELFTSIPRKLIIQGE